MHTEEETDLSVLQDCWNEWHCESMHAAPGNSPCLHVPVAIALYSCHRVHNVVCQTHVEHVERAQEKHKSCHECQKAGRGKFDVAKSWRIVPL